jgi:hypothetical protein
VERALQVVQVFLQMILVVLEMIQQVLVLQLKVEVVEHTLELVDLEDQLVALVMVADLDHLKLLEHNLVNQVYQEFLDLEIEVVDH